ncbi:hypothetical protein DL89DRAFT_293898 [Linderina pennispora]|uniref:CBM21 domain-containing protein n=1 Tax=Linderina pennispora TaxID=61395 RepID=A0A1Y1W623_9FUNG|nr:uncharacterized protein DL89DRAFT_293898 [Linderina pennispora]ORX68686.1 hypothetical protein DL89DRAFT_293898 [Linderina pennispora]
MPATSPRRLTLILRPQNKPTPHLPSVACTASGKRIKSCMKKSSSVCGQSGKVPRFVHFGATLEHTRWFYKSETPKHASADPRFESQDHETCGDELRLVPLRKPSPSFSPFEPSPVVLESVEYARGTLTGTIKVHNLAFEKQVSVRLTTDEWKTVVDVTAEFLRSVAPVDGVRPGVDRFRFKHPLKAEPTQVSICVRYGVNDQEFWDNNQGANYCFKLAAAAPKRAVSEPLVRKPQNNFAFAAPARRSPSPSYGVSAADASRYMRYSEAAFNEPPAQPAGYPLFAATSVVAQCCLCHGQPLLRRSAGVLAQVCQSSDAHRLALGCSPRLVTAADHLAPLLNTLA